MIRSMHIASSLSMMSKIEDAKLLHFNAEERFDLRTRVSFSLQCFQKKKQNLNEIQNTRSIKQDQMFQNSQSYHGL